MALEPARLSDFQVNEPIGAGATSQVYDALHRATGRRVAIKMLEPEASTSAELRERLAREAYILSGVESKHVGRVFGFGYHGEQPFLVLERLHGETLDALIRREGQPTMGPAARGFVQWVAQLLVGLRDCHAAGVVHRDIKPANVFLIDVQEEGRAPRKLVKLIDFGVARLREVAAVSGGLTQTRHVLGSMGYMAPEQFQNAKGVGPPADLYAVGVVVFRVIAGRLPFVNRSIEAAVRMKLENDPPLASSMPNVAHIPALDEFCRKALARDPDQRFLTAEQMLVDWCDVGAQIDPASSASPDIEHDVLFEDEPD
jgi:eukaryotic-like serine/threonine-protein kinase